MLSVHVYEYCCAMLSAHSEGGLPSPSRALYRLFWRKCTMSLWDYDVRETPGECTLWGQFVLPLRLDAPATSSLPHDPAA